MDLGTLGGVGLGGALLLMAIMLSGTGVATFIEPISFLVVIGGSLSAMMVANPLSRVLGAMKFINIALNEPSYQEEKYIQQLVTFSEKARREGLLALEDDISEVDEEFMQRGIQLVVDGNDPDIIRSIMYNELNKIQERHEIGISFFDTWGKIAPAFGMIGTLIGLIGMLKNLGGDQSAIGINMAVALITTLYGAVFANLVLIPIKTKLEDRDKSEALVKEIVVEGILSIQSGDNPRILEEKLLAFLPPDRREAARMESGARE
ncbi:MAG: motility protein A [Spirochaetales bacterium]|nr:motility protein A [Spirochaetales bacterium]MCF7937607.1 motility protein A [Spirochaetales bacterium]